MLATILVVIASSFTAPFPISPDGSRFVECPEGSSVLQIVDSQSGKVRSELTGLGFRPYVIAFSPDGKRVAASNTLGEVCLWNVESGKLVFKATDGDTRRISAYIPLVFSPDGRSLAVGNLGLKRLRQPGTEAEQDKGGLSLWDVRTGKRISEIRTGSPWPIAQFAFVNHGHTLRVLGSHITDFDLPLKKAPGKEWPWPFSAMSEDGSLASDFTPGWITVWDVSRRKRVLHIKDPDPNPIDRLVIAPGGKCFAILRKRTESYADTGYSLTRAELWSCPGGKLLWTTPESVHNTLCFSPDGSTVLLPNLELRSVPSGKVMWTFKDTELPALGRQGRWLSPRRR